MDQKKRKENCLNLLVIITGIVFKKLKITIFGFILVLSK